MSCQTTTRTTLVFNAVIGLLVIAEAVCLRPGLPDTFVWNSAMLWDIASESTSSIGFAPMSPAQLAVFSEGFEWRTS